MNKAISKIPGLKRELCSLREAISTQGGGQKITSLTLDGYILTLSYTGASGPGSVSEDLEPLFLNGNGSFVKAESYSTLPSGNEVGALAYVSNSEGNRWLSTVSLGNYYPQGFYEWDGNIWISNRNAIADTLHSFLDGTLNTNKHLTVTGDYMATVEDYHIEVKSTATISFPSVLNLNKAWKITNSGEGVVTLQANASETINEENFIILQNKHESVELESDEISNLIIT